MIFSRSSVFYSTFNSSFRECDAIMVSTSYIYESASLDAMKQWFSDMQKKVHVLGPLLPPGYGTEPQGTEEEISNDIQAFLKEMLAQHGKQSAFFVRSFPSFWVPTTYSCPQVSFGTIFWPSVSEYIDELIEALIEKKVPFVRGSCFPYNNFMLHAHYPIRFLVMGPYLPNCRSNRWRKSSHRVWEC